MAYEQAVKHARARGLNQQEDEEWTAVEALGSQNERKVVQNSGGLNLDSPTGAVCGCLQKKGANGFLSINLWQARPPRRT